LVAVPAYILLNQSRWGRYLFAIGSNKEAARLSGVNVNAMIYLAYVLSAFCAAFVGVLLAMRIGIGNPTQAEGWELQAIASSVIGGTSLFGAVGSIHGPLIGSFILTTINNGANLLNLTNPVLAAHHHRRPHHRRGLFRQPAARQALKMASCATCSSATTRSPNGVMHTLARPRRTTTGRRRRRFSNRRSNSRQIGRRRGSPSARRAKGWAKKTAPPMRSAPRSRPIRATRRGRAAGWPCWAKDRRSTRFPLPMSRGCSTITRRASTRIWQANSAIADPTSVLDRLDARRFSRCIDLGCGTGLAGAALRERVDTLIGVDPSPRMIAKARETGLYDSLEVGDAVAFLDSPAARSADLIVVADLFAYIGDLSPIFEAVAPALANGGRLAFSVEARESEGYRLGPAMRFAHSDPYVRETAIRAGLRRHLLAHVSIRREAGLGAPGLLGVYARK